MLVLAFHHKQDLMSADERGCQCLHAATEAERGDPVSDPERTLLDQNLLECRPAVLMQIKYQLSHQKVLTFLFSLHLLSIAQSSSTDCTLCS